MGKFTNYDASYHYLNDNALSEEEAKDIALKLIDECLFSINSKYDSLALFKKAAAANSNPVTAMIAGVLIYSIPVDTASKLSSEGIMGTIAMCNFIATEVYMSKNTSFIKMFDNCPSYIEKAASTVLTIFNNKLDFSERQAVTKEFNEWLVFQNNSDNFNMISEDEFNQMWNGATDGKNSG